MDESVARAIAKWPNVPAVFGWLGLSRRGQWLLRGEPIVHARAVAFMNRNYEHDEQGRWFFQNGPQRVFVALEGAPWAARLEVDRLALQPGEKSGQADAAYLSERGDVYFQTAHGLAMLDDRDLLEFSERLVGADGARLDDDTLEALLESLPAGRPSSVRFVLDASRPEAGLDVCGVAEHDLESRFGFVRAPREPDRC